MPAASSAAARLSPARAVTGSPSTDSVTLSPPISGSRSNTGLAGIEPPGAEGGELGIEPPRGDHRRDRERVVGGEGDAAVAGRNERAGTARRLLVDREAVLRHDAQRRPAAHDVEAAEQREHAQGAAGDGRDD